VARFHRWWGGRPATGRVVRWRDSCGECFQHGGTGNSRGKWRTGPRDSQNAVVTSRSFRPAEKPRYRVEHEWRIATTCSRGMCCFRQTKLVQAAAKPGAQGNGDMAVQLPPGDHCQRFVLSCSLQMSRTEFAGTQRTGHVTSVPGRDVLRVGRGLSATESAPVPTGRRRDEAYTAIVCKPARYVRLFGGGDASKSCRGTQ
jgi:hypothetical protein